MEPVAGGVAGRRQERLGWMRTPAFAAGLLLIERWLVAVMDTPMAQLRTLRELGPGPTDPVTPLLALLALLAEVAVGYVLVVVALRTLSQLPGWTGRLAGRITFLLSPDLVRRLLDLLVGGTLIAQVTLTALPGVSPSPRPGGVQAVTAPRLASVGPIGPAEARPSSRRLAAPLPPWLGGGPSSPAPRHTVEPGDTLWGIAATHLGRSERSSRNVHRYWQRIYRANRQVIGADPDLIRPGARLDVPPFRDRQR